MDEKVNIDNLDIKLRIIVFTENKHFSDLQWDLIVKGKALRMIAETLSFLFQEDIDFIVKEYPSLVRENKESE